MKKLKTAFSGAEDFAFRREQSLRSLRARQLREEVIQRRITRVLLVKSCDMLNSTPDRAVAHAYGKALGDFYAKLSESERREFIAKSIRTIGRERTKQLVERAVAAADQAEGSSGPLQLAYTR